MISDILPKILAECGLDRTAASIGDTDFEMSQLRAMMDAAGEEINSRVNWTRGERQLTVADTSSVDLPAGFMKLAGTSPITMGLYDHIPVRQVTSTEMWMLLERMPSRQPYFRMENNSIKFIPAVGTQGATIRYQVKNWVLTEVGEERSSVSSNGDSVQTFPERLLLRGTILRWKRQKGLPYADLLAEFEADLATEAKADRGEP